MNGGTFLKILLLLGLGAAGGYLVMRNNVEKIRKEFAEDQDTLKGFKKSVADRMRELDSVNSRTAAALEQVAQNDALTKKKAELTQSLSDLDQEQKKLTQEFASTIQRVRSAGVGTELPELKLGTGIVLKDAKIEKVTESEMLVSHAGGVSRLAVKDIPSDLVARFRFGDPVMTGNMPVAPVPAFRPAPAPALKTSDATPPAAAPPSKSVAEGQMYELKTKVATLQTQTTAAERQRDDYKREAANYLSKHSMNRSSATYVDVAGTVVSSGTGRTDSYNITAKEYEKKAADLDARITVAKTQIAAMQVEIERLQSIVNR